MLKILKGETGLEFNILDPNLTSAMKGSKKLFKDTTENTLDWDMVALNPDSYKNKIIAQNYSSLLTQPAGNASATGAITGQVNKFATGLNSSIPAYEQNETTKSVSDVASSVGNLLSSTGEPTMAAIGAGIQADMAIKKLLDGFSNGATSVKNAKGWDAVLEPFALLGSLQGLTATNVAGTDKSLLNNIKGYGVTAPVETREVGAASNIQGTLETFSDKFFNKKEFSSIFAKGNSLKDSFGNAKDWLKNTFSKENFQNAAKGTTSGLEQAQITANRSNYENLFKQRASKKAEEDLALGQTNFRDYLNKNQTTLQGGVDLRRLFKNGASIKRIARKFQSGGKVNVIPDGALHARRNEFDDENITNKGIPVVTYEDGAVMQHAEIERDELILNLDVTTKLEELNKKYKEGDEKALIEAGKLLTYEILENTEDNTNLINTVE